MNTTKATFSSIKSKIFIFFIFLLIVLQSILFLMTKFSYENKALEQEVKSFSQAKAYFKDAFEGRNRSLKAFTESSAKDQAIQRSLLTDLRSLAFTLNGQRKLLDADIAMAFDPNNIVLAELFVKDSNQEIKRVTEGNLVEQIFHQPHWLTAKTETVYYFINNRIYQLAISPIINKENLVGHIAFGFEVNHSLIATFSRITGLNMLFGYKDENGWHNLALPETESQSRSLSSKNAIDPSSKWFSDSYNSDTYNVGSTDAFDLYITSYKPQIKMLESIEEDSTNLLVVLMITIVLSLLGAFLIAQGVTHHLRSLLKLSKDIAKGKYQSDIYLGNIKELNQLVEQFQVMQDAIQSREKKITNQAFFDSLTKLPNRNQFYQDMHGFECRFILCQINIRRLAEFNDTLGHVVGDEVIQEVADRLKTLNVPLYHTSGNGFLVRFDQKSFADVKTSTDLIEQVIEPSFTYQNIALHLQVNIGVTVGERWPNANQILKEVDAAMQIAKRQNLLFQLYDRQIDQNTLDRLQLVNRIKHAIENDEFTLYFQPKLSIQNSTIEEVEALVRWQHPVNGLINPDAFIHIAEQTGQMRALSMWVINKAIEQYFIWQAKGIELKIAINISPENLLDEDFCQLMVSKLAGKRTLYKALVFEITEDAFVDHESKAVDNIKLLKKHGFTLSIDDYGTGYSSLAQLKTLSVQELKIDRSFVQYLPSEPRDQLIVSSTITLAHQLGLSVVAEGVEDSETLSWLRTSKCEKAQGYYISRPLTPAQFNQWIEHTNYHIVPVVSTSEKIEER